MGDGDGDFEQDAAMFSARVADASRQLKEDMRAPGYDPMFPPRQITISIPPEVEQYATDIQRFVDAMVYKLSVHSAKGKWENLSPAVAMGLLRGEEKELTEAINRGNMVEILLESADVANYALIIASIAVEKRK